MTDTGGLFCTHYFRQSIPKRQSALIAQLRPVSAMTDKDRRGINNFKTNTRGQIKPYARGKIIWYLWNHKTLHL
jgi:hypothetical protein|nr:MAG TPA: hypothetical protein [Caudoviricetes sp.]